jgi:hypothetical protein
VKRATLYQNNVLKIGTEGPIQHGDYHKVLKVLGDDSFVMADVAFDSEIVRGRQESTPVTLENVLRAVVVTG